MQFRLATPEDSLVVAEVLSAVAENLRKKDLALWSLAEVSESAVSPHIRDGLYHLGMDGAEVIGVFRLEMRDPTFWPEIPDGTSAYLHKLAVLPERQGQNLAHILLQHAVGLTKARGMSFLRLDCMGGRPKLRSVYEQFGFQHHSQILLRGQTFDRYEFPVEVFPERYELSRSR
jgi:GNAT superfamily N-acetyltransferase